MSTTRRQLLRGSLAVSVALTGGAQAIRELGPMDGRTCERLPRFLHYGTTTVRKRVSELADPGREGGPLLVAVATAGGRFPVEVYELVDLVDQARERFTLPKWEGEPRAVVVCDGAFYVPAVRGDSEFEDLRRVFEAALRRHDEGSGDR